MLIVVSTLSKWFLGWRCDSNFSDNLDRITVGLSKGCSLALITYLVIKMTAIAHDNEWELLFTGWGQYYIFEICVGVILPLFLYAFAIRGNSAKIARVAAFIAVFGIALNRLNTALITFNYKLYQEIPHWREALIAVTIYVSYIVVYRACLVRLPILFTWKSDEK